MLFLYYYIYLIFLQYFLMFIIEFWAFSFYIKTAKDCFFFCQPICVYATITASMCFEIDPGHVQKYHTQFWILQYLNNIKGNVHILADNCLMFMKMSFIDSLREIEKIVDFTILVMWLWCLITSANFINE